MLPRRRAPLWFHVLAAIGLAVMLRECTSGLVSHPGPETSPQLAFWAFFVTLVELIWNGVQATVAATVQFLSWAVAGLWTVVKAAGDLFLDMGKVVIKGAKQTWSFFRWTYDHVLRPAWEKFFKFVDWAHTHLEKTFKPVLDALFWLRKHVLDFYTTWVRPIIDSIDIARRALRVLATFGLDWAKTLDRQLGELEDRIQQPFRLLLAKINATINLVNRVVTADGLFQRLALLQSTVRDAGHIGNILARAHSKPLTDDELKAIAKARGEPVKPSVTFRDVQEWGLTDGGPRASKLDELLTQVLREPA